QYRQERGPSFLRPRLLQESYLQCVSQGDLAFRQQAYFVCINRAIRLTRLGEAPKTNRNDGYCGCFEQKQNGWSMGIFTSIIDRIAASKRTIMTRHRLAIAFRLAFGLVVLLLIALMAPQASAATTYSATLSGGCQSAGTSGSTTPV